MTSTGLFLLMVAAGSLPDQCLLGPANCAALKQMDADHEARCRRFRDTAAVLRPACDHGRGDNCLELAELMSSCRHEETIEETLDLYIRACALGEPNACMRAGDRASSPAARKSWYRRTLAIYEKECANGDAVACHALSSWLFNGSFGTERDQSRAAELAAQSCRMGLVDACYHASMLFKMGPGTIEVDEKRAEELMKLNCRPGRQHFACTATGTRPTPLP